ncbi:mannosyltransferase putative-domain-containing protein [Mrakia frigida]|uniref:mannosyltransferase putative-domain-containing protein n=1 Tax=Mrakia frigida TaxID=29902 RepID=UPI003FCBFE3B
MSTGGLLPSVSFSSSSSSPPSSSRLRSSLDNVLNNLHRTAKSPRRAIPILVVISVLGVLGFGWKEGKLSEVHSTLFRPSPIPTLSLPPLPPPPPPPELLNLAVSVQLDLASQPLPLKTSTRDRLSAWATAPGGRGDDVEGGEITIEQMRLQNVLTCENVWPSHSFALEKEHKQVWEEFDTTKAHFHRTRLIEKLASREALGEVDAYGEGRGIVFTAGDGVSLSRVVYTLRMLRKVYNSTLPAQIYHFPSEKPPSDSVLVKEAHELGAELVEAVGTTKDLTRGKNYHLKAIAIVQCPWREVLYLDSDNIPTRDPEYMFEAEPYKRLRAMFWPDYWKTAHHNPIWAIMGVRCRNEWEMEAGQILIDKKYHMDAMLLSQHMLEDWPFFFAFSDGDKDIFRFAFLALRKRWAVPGRYLGVGAPPEGRSHSFCGLTMMQYDHLGAPLFVHYNLLKQAQEGTVHEGFSWGRTKRFPLFLAAKHDSQQPNSTLFIEKMRTSAQDVEDLDFEDDFGRERGFGDVDCDMLADSDDEGHARAPATEEVRRRAATERGSRAFFHCDEPGLCCVNTRYDDPRPTDLRQGESSLGIMWDEGDSNMEVHPWTDDPLLKGFEESLYGLGFVPGGQL